MSLNHYCTAVVSLEINSANKIMGHLEKKRRRAVFGCGEALEVAHSLPPPPHTTVLIGIL